MSSLRVLAICAHPDDYEYSASATLSKLAVNGNIIKGLVLTRGEKGGNGAKRVIEAKESASRLGFEHAEVLEFPDTKLPEHIPEISGVIKKTVEEFDPHLIFTHSAHDRHQDHVAVYRATIQAVSHCLILCFESPSSRDFKADCGVYIGKSLKNKMNCIAVHADQGKKPYMQPDHIIKWTEERGNMECFELEPEAPLDDRVEDIITNSDVSPTRFNSDLDVFLKLAGRITCPKCDENALTALKWSLGSKSEGVRMKNTPGLRHRSAPRRSPNPIPIWSHGFRLTTHRLRHRKSSEHSHTCSRRVKPRERTLWPR